MFWFWWISGLLLGVLWSFSAIQAWLHADMADITQPEWDPGDKANLSSLTVIVPARNEEAEIRPALLSLLQLNHPDLKIVAINDRSTDRTGEIMEEILAADSCGRSNVLFGI